MISFVALQALFLLVLVVGQAKAQQLGDFCTEDAECGADAFGELYCIFNKCAEPGGLGANCENPSDDRQCAGQLICLFNKCSEKAGEGDACGKNSDCDRVANLYCNSGVCTKKGDGDLGDTCQDTNLDCANPFVCSDGRCDRPWWWSLFPFCFSGNSIVEVQDRGRISMNALKIGDLVLTSNGTFAKVYSFGHYQQKAETEFLQIQASSVYQNQALEITKDHLLYVCNGNRNFQIVPAGTVKVGDFLITESGEATPITSIRKVQRRGAYAPLTTNGNIVVNGVLASNYVSRAWLQGYLSGQTLHWLQHGAALPFRFFCSLAGC